MSGGYWEYQDQQLERVAEMIAADSRMIARFPRLAVAIRDMLGGLAEITRNLDRDFSADHQIGVTDREFEARAIERLRRALDPADGVA